MLLYGNSGRYWHMCFSDKLVNKIIEKNNPSIVGLDPKLEYVPDFIKNKAFKEYGVNYKGASEAILEFNRKIIDSVCDIVPAVKPQSAYYEMYGREGLEVLGKTIAYAAENGLLVILDAKRNDIGSTAEAYSSAYLGRVRLCENSVSKGYAENPAEAVSYEILAPTSFNVDAITVNPYLGYDGIKPFLDDCKLYGKGIFILVKTSNKTSSQIQDIMTEKGKYIYETVAEYVDEWGKSCMGSCGYSSIGAVVGATYPEQSGILRKIMKNSIFLVPGYGAQGGSAADVVPCFNKDGLGAIINASRSIMCAYRSEKWRSIYNEPDFLYAARAEAICMRDEIVKALREVTNESSFST
jgi:orotidine-5'-phosphate decarboxylase